MTMVPSHQNGNNTNNRSTNYVFCNSKGWNNTTTSAMNQVHEVEGSYNYSNCLLGSDFVLRRRHMMAEQQDSRTNNNTTNTPQNEEAQVENDDQVVGSTSKGDQEEGEGEDANIDNNNNNNNNNWLQLSIGFHHSTSSPTTKHDHHQASSLGGSLVELELLPSGSSSSSRPCLLEPQTMSLPPMVGHEVRGGLVMRSSSFIGGSSSLLFEQTSMSNMASGTLSSNVPTLFGHHHQLQTQPQEMMNWTFGPLLPHSMANIMPSSNSSSSLLSQSLRPPNFPPPLGSNYFSTTPFHHFTPSGHGFDHQFDVGAGPSSSDVTTTVRVVDPPRRPHSGIWFMLQASQNQVREPFLPQIPKSYLRIKDGRMTVRLLFKYLVSKLRLDNESEIEITCRGQQLLPFLTLQHVRDNIWTPRDTSRTLLSDSSTTTDHVMVLHYGRSAA